MRRRFPLLKGRLVTKVAWTGVAVLITTVIAAILLRQEYSRLTTERSDISTAGTARKRLGRLETILITQPRSTPLLWEKLRQDLTIGDEEAAKDTLEEICSLKADRTTLEIALRNLPAGFRDCP